MNTHIGAGIIWIRRVAPREGLPHTIRADVNMLNDLHKHHGSILHQKLSDCFFFFPPPILFPMERHLIKVFSLVIQC